MTLVSIKKLEEERLSWSVSLLVVSLAMSDNLGLGWQRVSQ